MYIYNTYNTLDMNRTSIEQCTKKKVASKNNGNSSIVAKIAKYIILYDIYNASTWEYD